MVIDRIKKLLGEKEEKEERGEAPEEVIYTLEDIGSLEEEPGEEWIEKGEVEEIKASLLQTLEKIEGWEFGEEEKRRMENSPPYRQVLKLRPKFVREMNSAIEKIPSSGKLPQFHRQLSAGLKVVNNVLSNQGSIMALTFKEEMSDLGKDLKRLSEIEEEVSSEINRKKEENDFFNSLHDRKENIENIQDQIENLKRDRSRMEKEIEEIEGAIGRKNKELESLRHGREYKGYREKKERLHSLEEELKLKRNRIINHFGGLSRVLKKYHKRMESSGAPGSMEAIEGYLNEPVKFLVRDRELKKLKALLKTLDSQISQGKYGFKGKSQKKALKNIKRVDFSFLENNSREIVSMEKEIKRLSRELEKSEVDREKTNLEEEISSLKEKKKENKKEEERLKNLLDKKNNELEKERERLEGLLVELKGEGAVLRL